MNILRSLGGISLKKIGLITLALFVGCASLRGGLPVGKERGHVIDAPVTLVWDKLLTILPDEGMLVTYIDKNHYAVYARWENVTAGRGVGEISIRLVPKKRETLVATDFGAEDVIDSSLEEQMGSIINRLKRECEGL